MPLVSVIIPCYRQAHFLPDAIGSLIAQSLGDWECIIINDGSPDNTREIALALATEDKRIRYIEQENRGLSGARNRGLKESKGTWIQFLDADDILLPEKLHKQLDVLIQSPGPALSFCDYYFCDAHDIDKRVTKGHDFEHPRFLHDNPLIDLISRWETDMSIPIHAFLFDSRLFKEAGVYFDQNLPNHEDWDCWMRIFHQRPIIVPLHQELVVYRQHPNSMATNKIAMWRGYEQAISKQSRLFRHSPLITAELKKKLTEMHMVYFGKPKNLARRWLFSVDAQFGAISKKIVGLYRRFMPWPIQVRLRKMVSNNRR